MHILEKSGIQVYVAALRGARVELLLQLVAARLETRRQIAHCLQVAHQLVLLELHAIE